MESKLEVWKLANQLRLEVYKVSKNFPSSEKYGLTRQVRRSSSSVPTNILEGQGRRIKRSLFNFYILQKVLWKKQIIIIFSKGSKLYNRTRVY